MSFSGSVMIVDDSRVQREHLAALCGALGVATVLLAVDGADALAQIDALAEPPDAMIIDLEMPVLDGVELIQQMHHRTLHIPFALASTRETGLIETVELMARMQGLPVIGSLRKPITEALLRGALQALDACVKAAQRPQRIRGEALPAVDAAEIAGAIAGGRIVPYYQPKVHARTGVICGVEALARWNDAALGNPTPDRFIAAAESSGQIHGLTMAILAQSFAQAAYWSSRGLRLTVSVNLSPQLLESAALVGQIEALALAHGMLPQRVVLEITEGTAVAAQGAALGVLARLRMKGFRLSIDDYGTGFSSMQQLSRVAWTELKIDRSFVDGVHRHEHQRVILQSAIDMTSRLSMVSVAEGVETLEDWRLLQHFGCTVGQGWLFGRAMPADELPAWLKQHGRRLPELRAIPREVCA